MSDPVYREEIRTNVPQPTPVIWGAIFAGAFALIGLSWLLKLLGVSIGVSIADAWDDTLLDSGMTQGMALWMVGTSAVAYFCGSAIASRLSGTTDETVGVLHGVTLWGVGTVATIVITYCGIVTLVQTGGSVAAGVGSAATTLVGGTARGVASGAQAVGQAAYSVTDVNLNSQVRDRLKNRVAKAIASVDSEGGAEVTATEVREAIDSLDADAFDQLVADLVNDDQDSAAELIASSTELNAAQARALVEGAYQSLEERFGNPDNDETLAEDLRTSLSRRGASWIATFDPRGGPEVSKAEIAEALASLDAAAFQKIATHLVNGDTNAARDRLVEETDLSGDQVEEILRGVQSAFQKRLDAALAEANKAAEAASTYAQQVLWLTFASSAIGLAISVLGGWCGVDATRRVYYEVRPATPAE